MAAEAKKKNGVHGSEYFVVTEQMPEHATLFGMYGDCGMLIDPIKMHNIPPSRVNQLERLYSLKKLTVSDVYECRCGLKFDSEGRRETHIHRRHLAKNPHVVDLQDLSDEQQQGLLNDTGQYWTGPGDFSIPDPEDKRTAADDRRVADQVIAWEKTEASQK